MLSKELRKQLKQDDIGGHPECPHNWIHYAGKQCDWDVWSFEEHMNGIKPHEHIKDSRNIVNMYICTMCGGQFWSTDKLPGIDHYVVKQRVSKKGGVSDGRKRKSKK